jgi:hypothetical protein
MRNWQPLHAKLIAAARACPPGDNVPYAFEKRIMSLLKARGATNHALVWVHGLWRAAASCMLLALLLGVWAFFNPAVASGDDLIQNFENTLLASVDQSDQP